MERAVQAFVSSHDDAQFIENGKVVCTLTCHEMAAQLPVLEAYWNGKKYRTAKSRSGYDFSQHEPYLVPHTKNKHLMYCTLTKQPVNRDPRAIEGHINGKRFRNAKMAALASPAAASSAQDEDEEELVEDDEANEVEDFLSSESAPFWEQGSEGEADDEPPTVERDMGKQRAAEKQGAPGKRARRGKGTAPKTQSKAAAMDVDEEEDAFWVRGSGDVRPTRPKKLKKKAQLGS